MSKINHRPDCIDQSTCEGMIRSRDDAIAAQGRVLAELRAENDRLSGLMNGDVILKTVTYTREDGTQAEVQHWAVKLLAGSLLDTFKEFGGENFVTFTLNSSDGPLEVTIRPCWGGKKTAAEVLGELRAENERLRQQIDELLSGCGSHSCKVQRPHGQGNNGPCRCVEKLRAAIGLE